MFCHGGLIRLVVEIAHDHDLRSGVICKYGCHMAAQGAGGGRSQGNRFFNTAVFGRPVIHIDMEAHPILPAMEIQNVAGGIARWQIDRDGTGFHHLEPLPIVHQAHVDPPPVWGFVMNDGVIPFGSLIQLLQHKAVLHLAQTQDIRADLIDDF